MRAQTKSAQLREERRRQVLNTAEKLFRHYGPAKTTIADIAREAGIGVGSIYLEFDSKDAIITELSRRRHDAVLIAMRSAAQAATSHAERLCATLEAQVEALFRLADQGSHACDLVLCPSAPVQTTHAGFQEVQRELIADLLRDGARAGVFAIDDPDAAATVLQRAYASFSPPWLFEQERQAVRSQMASLNHLLLRGLLSRV